MGPLSRGYGIITSRVSVPIPKKEFGLAFSSELAFRAGGFRQSSTWQMAREGQPAQAARPNIVSVYGACAVCQCVLVQIYGGVFMRDSGRSLYSATRQESRF